MNASNNCLLLKQGLNAFVLATSLYFAIPSGNVILAYAYDAIKRRSYRNMSKWLIRKTSGSLSKHKSKGDYADHRQGRKDVDFEHLPQRESMRHKGAHHTYLDTSLVKRWLHSKVGEPFDQVYSEFLTRIQPKYLDEYKDSIYWYVAPQAHVEVKPNGEVWGKSYGRPVQLPHGGHLIFYVDPATGMLMRKDKA